MRSVPQFAIVIALTGATLIALPARAQQPQPPVLTVTASGEVRVKPDVAHLTIGVVSRDKSALQAQEETNRKMTATLAAIKALGIADEHTQTSTLTVASVTAEQGSGNRLAPIVGYEARNQVTIRVENLAGLGAIIDARLAAEANELQRVQFDLSNLAPARREAYAKAAAEARATAEAIAEAFGVRIAGIARIETRAYAGTSGGLRDGFGFNLLGGVAPTPVQVGEVAVSCTTAVEYRIIPR